MIEITIHEDETVIIVCQEEVVIILEGSSQLFSTLRTL